MSWQGEDNHHLITQVLQADIYSAHLSINNLYEKSNFVVYDFGLGVHVEPVLASLM
jgi:hypothetical protein